MVLKKVKKTIESYHMIESGKPIIVGLSGGPDSMTLLDVLSKITNNPLIAVHLNHQFRGEEADEDAAFVRQECEKRKIPVIIKTFNVPAYMSETGLGAQEAAREIRYQFYVDIAKKKDAEMIALGHHANDQAETLFMRILRGTGVHGLAGIPYVRFEGKYKIIRPLLDITREEIEQYCIHHSIPFRVDNSNLSRKYFRNEMRLEVFPYLMKYNPNFISHLHQLGKVIQDENQYLHKATKKALEECVLTEKDHTYSLDVSKFKTFDIALQRRMIHLILKYLHLTKEFTYHHIDGIIDLIMQEHPSKSLDLPGVRVYRNYNELMMTTSSRKDFNPYHYELNIPGMLHLENIHKRITAYTADHYEEKQGIWAVFDFDSLKKKPLIVRSRKNGDRMNLLGMNGSKKVKDIFIDQKIPKEQRDLVPLLESDGTILWIPGIARSRHALISDLTKSFLYVVVEDI